MLLLFLEAPSIPAQINEYVVLITGICVWIATIATFAVKMIHKNDNLDKLPELEKLIPLVSKHAEMLKEHGEQLDHVTDNQSAQATTQAVMSERWSTLDKRVERLENTQRGGSRPRQ